jgi:Tol biopolymer transport system component
LLVAAAATASVSLLLWGGPARAAGGANGTIAFHRNGDIYVVRANGTGERRVVGGAAFDGYPAWSPDGRKIAFQTLRDGDLELFRVNADGSSSRRLTSDEGADVFPAWSPDGTKIAFASTRASADPEEDLNWEIYVMNRDGSEPTRLTSDPAFDTEPTWSPDGAQIAFSSDRGAPGDSEIFVMDADGTGVQRLTDGPGIGSRPSWSPDGGLIAYTRFALDGSSAIHVVELVDGRETSLSPAGSLDAAPAWSPDQTKIVFEVSPTEGSASSNDLYVMNADGTERVRLRGTPADEFAPDWRPLPARPVNSAAPMITGTARAGETLTATAGRWIGTEPLTRSFQWQRCDEQGAECVEIPGSENETHLVLPADVGLTLRVVVTVANRLGAASATSDPTPIVGSVVVGSRGADVLSGLEGSDVLRSGPGSDVVDAGGGDDVVYGAQGADVLRGGSGDDILRGGTGADRVYAGAGVDRVFAGPGDDWVFARDDTRDWISCGAGVDTVIADPGDRVRDCETVRRG